MPEAGGGGVRGARSHSHTALTTQLHGDDMDGTHYALTMPSLTMHSLCIRHVLGNWPSEHSPRWITPGSRARWAVGRGGINSLYRISAVTGAREHFNLPL
jgi:hypothetical protein